MNASVVAPAPVPDFLCRMDDNGLRQFAKRKADANARIPRAGLTDAEHFAQLVQEVAKLGIQAPIPGDRGKLLVGCLARLEDERWIRGALRRIVTRECERRARDAGQVHKFAGIYASHEAVDRRRRQRRRTRELLACMEAVNELGQSFTLDQLQDVSISNPRIRRSELMARIAGFELIAKELGHVAEFYTLSCPSRMHCRHARTGTPVARYDGTAPDEAHRYLGKQWQKIRAKLHRDGIRIYGIRVVEPHHDGTPHWHLLLFMEPADRVRVRLIVKHYALEVDGDEPGAAHHRFKVEPIDPRKGSAAAYVAKYISKNIDGYQLDTDTHGTKAEQAAERIEAWASTWRIRQFQQIGGPPVSVWRELRRADTAPDGILEEARQAADNGEWAEFVRLMRGPQAQRALQPVELARAWSDEPGRYGEPRGYMTFGVRAGDSTLSTRINVWQIAQIGSSGGASRERRNAPAAAAPPGLIHRWGHRAGAAA